MLGEGFDHPKLSVAAIFRPFRTLAPYIQFVGRIMRVVVQNDAMHPGQAAKQKAEIPPHGGWAGVAGVQLANGRVTEISVAESGFAAQRQFEVTASLSIHLAVPRNLCSGLLAKLDSGVVERGSCYSREQFELVSFAAARLTALKSAQHKVHEKRWLTLLLGEVDRTTSLHFGSHS